MRCFLEARHFFGTPANNPDKGMHYRVLHQKLAIVAGALASNRVYQTVGKVTARRSPEYFGGTVISKAPSGAQLR